jgi:hypothetical protein
MKPDWDKLMEEFKDHASIYVGDADCTAEAKSLCETVGVKGYPTIKHGDPNDLQDYQGGRDFDALSKFAKALTPACGPSNLDDPEICSDEQKEKIRKVMDMDEKDIQENIDAGDKKVKEAEEHFNEEVQKLQNAYQKLQEEKEKTVQEIADSGVGMYKSVLAYKKKNPPKEEKKEEL